ncbi:MAG: sugar phosphate nucleotidyltransferase [Bacteroidota bacterium]
MHIKKAVITAAARGGRLYPVGDTVQKAMLPLADSDGVHKPILQIIAEEAFESGIEDICLICAPGDEARYKQAFTTLRENLSNAYSGIDWAKQQAEKIDFLMNHLTFVVQAETLGYGHAVHCAKSFADGEPFLLLLGDHLYLSNQEQRCAKQLLNLASEMDCSVSAVNATPEYLIRQYGTLTGTHLGGQKGVYEIETIIEKPSISQAELHLMTAGLKAAHYLCFFGMHVLEADIFDLLERQMESATKGEDIPLTPALQALANTRKYLAMQMEGRRFNLGTHYGWLEAQIAFGLQSESSEELLAGIVNELAMARRKGV